MRKSNFYLILFLIITNCAFAQNPSIDSLNQVLESEIHDTTKISILIEISKSLELDNIDTSILILENTARLCNKVAVKYPNNIRYYIQKQKAHCLFNLIALYETEGDSANQFFYLRKCQDLRSTLHDTIGLIDLFVAKGLYYSNHGKHQQALKYFNKSLKYANGINYQKGIAEAYNNIGYVYNNNGQIDLSLETYFKGLLIQEQIEDLKGASSTLNNIAYIYFQQENYKKALEYWQKSLKYRMQTKDKDLISHSLLNLGSVYFRLGDTPKALEYFEKSYEIQLANNDKLAGAYSLNNIGFIYNQQKDYKNAEKYWNKCLKIRREINDKKGQVYSLQNLSSLYINIKKNDLALITAQEAVKLSNQLGILSLSQASYFRLYQVQLKRKFYKEALNNFIQYSNLKDSILNETNTQSLAERDAKYKYDIKQIADSISYTKEIKIKDLNLSKQKAIVQKQKIQQYALSIGLVLILIILILGYRNLKSKQKANLLLQKQKNEIEAQTSELYSRNEEIQSQRDEISYRKDEIEKIHADVKDSIVYAKNIQNAMLPNKKLLDNNFSDSFVFFKPKDVVSGDFYWWSEVEGQTIITAADCTGHGVPGAFMSMLGISFLREIVNKEYITHTGVILRRLRKEIVKSLKQKEKSDLLTVNDGMDMSLVSINHKNNILQFSGANNPIYIITKNKRALSGYESIQGFDGFFELKPDKMPIGLYDKMDRFTTQEIQLEKGDQIYLFSDGYADQFGGPKGKKFKYRAFKKLILQHSNRPMIEQREILFSTLKSWQGIEEQVDDLVVLGIKI